MVKNKLRSLLGIEMSLNGYEFKPFILILGILLFITLSIPLMLVYCYLYIKNTLIISWNDIKKHNRNDKNRPLKRV